MTESRRPCDRRPEPGAQLARLPDHDDQPAEDDPPALRGDAPRAVRRGVFTAMVPEAVDFVEAIAQRKPVAQFKPKGAAAKAIQALADELERRLAQADTRGITRETQGAA